MSSQSAQHRTTANAAVGSAPAIGSRSEACKVNDWDAPVSWWWLPAIGGGAYVLFAYIVPAAANLLLELFH